jgi:hypothetical protein
LKDYSRLKPWLQNSWVAGALESAERCALHMLELNKLATIQGHPWDEERDEIDLVKQFERKWRPDFGVDKEILIQQLFVSKKLQHAEFSSQQIL